MGELRLRGTAALRLAGVLVAAGCVIAVFSLLLRTPEPPPLPPELGLAPVEETAVPSSISRSADGSRVVEREKPVQRGSQELGQRSPTRAKRGSSRRGEPQLARNRGISDAERRSDSAGARHSPAPSPPSPPPAPDPAPVPTPAPAPVAVAPVPAPASPPAPATGPGSAPRAAEFGP